MATEARRATLEILLNARNATSSAFSAVHGSLAKIRQVGRDAFASVTQVAGNARAQLLGVVAALGGVQKLLLEPAAFEETLTRMSVSSRALEGEIDRVRKAIEDLAVSTGTAREDLAAGFDAAGRSAKNFEEVVQLVTTANKLATLTNGTVRDSVVELSQVMEGFGKDISDVEEVAAKLFETSRGMTGELIGELAQIGPQARDAGVSLEQLLAAVAAAEPAGQSATKTLTALRTILTQIVSPTEQSAELFERLRIQTGEQALAGKNLGEVFARMGTDARELGSNLRDLGIEGRATGAFLAIGAEEGKKFSAALAEVSGSTIPEFNAAFDAVGNTTKSLIDGFRELTKVAATAFARTQFEAIDRILKGASSEVERVRIQAELAGLHFAKWRAEISGAIAIGATFVKTLDTGLRTVNLILQGTGALMTALVLRARQAILEIRKFAADQFSGLIREQIAKAIEGAVKDIPGLAAILGTTARVLIPPLIDTSELAASIEDAKVMIQEFDRQTNEDLHRMTEGLKKSAQGTADSFFAIGAAFEQGYSAAREYEKQIASLRRELDRLSESAAHVRAVAELDSLQQRFSFSPPPAQLGDPAGQRAASLAAQAVVVREDALAGVRGAINRSLDQATAGTDWVDVYEKEAMEVIRISDQVRASVEGSFAGAFDGLVQGALTAKEAVRSFASSTLSELNRLVANNIFQSIFGGGTRGNDAPAGGFFQSIVSSIFAAKGGILPGSFMPVKAFAGGGVVTRPTIGIIREAGVNEAVVPLPDGKRIPVSLRGGGGTVIHNHNYYISAMDGPSVARVLTSAEGRRAIRASTLDNDRRRPPR